MTALIGDTLGHYRIIEKIGEGGMATVYKSYQSGLERYVAVKVLPPLHAEQPGFSERFQREAKAIANLHHPNILPVYDYGQEEGYSFIVMRYIEGARTLKEAMQIPLSLVQVADLIGQVAAALDHAHQQGVIHRDVKPSNVLMDGDWALLTDFGLARMAEVSMKLTGTGVGIGTPAYMSPEQGQGSPVDHRTDIYSLGIILFEMLTRQIPHNAETPFAIVIKRLTEPLPLPRAINPKIPEPVERVILKALAKAPEDRYQSAGEMAQALKGALELASGRVAGAREATTRQMELEQLYQEAQAKVESGDWAEAKDLCQQIEVLEGRGYRDVGELLERAEQGLRQRQAMEERQAHLAQLYAQLQKAIEGQDWGRVLTLGERIRAEDASYRDVAELMAYARGQLDRPQRRPIPSWAWIVGGVAVVALLVFLGNLAFNGGSAREPTPTQASTLAPVAAAAVTTPTPAPTQARTPTSTRTATPTATPGTSSFSSVHPTQIRPADGMVMVYVPGGTFQMGSDESDSGADDDEFPQHAVTLDSFWIDQTEVTNAQYRQCAEAGDCDAPLRSSSYTRDSYYDDSAYDDYPVINVNWNEADAYCKWARARLLTEAEWEYAARGERGSVYPWGDSPPDDTLLNYGGDLGDTTEVGSYPDGASWCGALDMSGNVWEWVADWYGDYPSEAQANPTGPADSHYKVLRGGSFYYLWRHVRVAYRYSNYPIHRHNLIGFRCAGSAPGG